MGWSRPRLCHLLALTVVMGTQMLFLHLVYVVDPSGGDLLGKFRSPNSESVTRELTINKKNNLSDVTHGVSSTERSPATTVARAAKTDGKCSVDVVNATTGRTITEVFDPSKVNSMRLFQCYPLAVNLTEIIENSRLGHPVEVVPLATYRYKPLLSAECKTTTGEDPFLVLLVKSAAANFEARQAIRATWCNGSINITKPVKCVFLLGLPNDFLKLPTIFKENKEFGDIVQDNFPDIYLHTRVKMTMGLQWAAKHCASTRYILLADDDVIINPWAAVSFLSSSKNMQISKMYMGSLSQQQHPHRVAPNKWYVSTNDYPFEDYPPFPPTGSLIVNMEFARDYVIAWPYVDAVHYDDVFLGIVARKLGVQPIDIKRSIVTHCSRNYLKNNFRSVISCMGEFTPAAIRLVWKLHHDKMEQAGFR